MKIMQVAAVVLVGAMAAACASGPSDLNQLQDPIPTEESTSTPDSFYEDPVTYEPDEFPVNFRERPSTRELAKAFLESGAPPGATMKDSLCVGRIIRKSPHMSDRFVTALVDPTLTPPEDGSSIYFNSYSFLDGVALCFGFDSAGAMIESFN